MSKPKSKRTKKYVPKYTSPAGGLSAILRIDARGINASSLNDDQRSDLGAGYWLAFTNLTQGNASEESWECVVCACNIGMALSETVFDHQGEEEIVSALDGLFRAKLRSERTGNYRLDGDAIQAVRAGLEIHDQQMQLAQRREIVAAMAVVRARIAEGNVYSGEYVKTTLEIA